MQHIAQFKKIVNHDMRMFWRFVACVLAVLGSTYTGTAQVSESGLYFIKSNADQTYYLCPTQDPSNPTVGYWVDDNLMLTTKKDAPVNHTVWRVVRGTGDNEDYFQIIHQSSGQYLINDKTDKVAEAAHLGTLPDDDANTWFRINYVGSYYNILGKAVTGAYSFNPYSGNRDTYVVYQAANTGIIGYWDGTDNNSKWQLVKASPSITETSGNFEIAFPAATIYYTTDGSDPTTSDTRQVYTSTFTLTGDDYKVRAVAEANGLRSDESVYIVHCPPPTISQSGAIITMSSTIPGAEIRYTTNGSDPTATSTLYSDPITLDFYTTIASFKAIAMLHDDDLSTVAVHNIDKCEPPVISSSDDDGTVTMTCATAGTKIRYTTNGSDPTATSTLYTDPIVLLPNGNTVTQIKAKAFYLGKRRSDAVTYNVSQCAVPVIINASGTVTITSTTHGATIYYATSGGDYVEYSTPFGIGSNSVIMAYATHAGYSNSDIATYTRDIEVARSSDIIDMNGRYVLSDGFVIDASVGTSEAPFAGTLDGQLVAIASASVPLVAYADGATIKNVIISDANITSDGHVGAIAASATGATRIYNCGILNGTVSGTGNVGSIVGMLDGEARVINCYSFADVSGGTSAAGIVGYNNVASTRANIKTMVMNCMYYGNVADAANISPIYGGQIINNSGNNALNNFNYYSFADFTSTITTYNCALGAEERFLTRFEFYRQILNSNRELAAWYATGSVANARMLMAKWVLDTVAPYPILKPQSKYTSIINYDPTAAPSLGTLKVTISSVGNNAPAGASITTSSLTLTRTDKDPTHYNFNYDKVQLPYYNDIGTKNYTGNRVVVGWKVTAITGGTAGTFKKEDSAEGYNFTDRNCTQKDLYSVTGRVLSQGAYFNVPNGVTAITIEPYWANAVYLSDPNYDKTYNNGYAGYNVTNMGTRFVNKQVYSINGSSQMVYTNMGDAISALNRASGKTVYDYAVVLVGNYHHYYGNNSINNDTKGLTIMSADLDGDNEPDNCFFYQHMQRQAVTPIRFDFLCWTGIGMAQKPSDSPRMPGIGIFKPRGWFEVTNTCTAQFLEVEYDWGSKNAESGGSPLILLGGVVEQITSSNDGAPTHTKYIHIGDNAWFKMFDNGIHQDKNDFTPHVPISVTGGDYERFYLSGMFKPTATVKADNAECYISGGRFGEVAGAGQEQINGNVTWKIDHADIESFYGGGINDAKPVLGNITVIIANSNVGLYCGGPKFGNMTSGKTVTTTATNCTFGRFFGAGYGGTSFNRVATKNLTNATNYGFSSWATSDYKRLYDSDKNGIATNYEYELFAYAGFADNNNVGRFYVNYASLSLATAGTVTSTLTDCTITENFYGGGNLGKVVGNVNSTLTSCTVLGNVYGAGFSAKAPTADVLPTEGFTVEPYYNGNTGTYTIGILPTAVTYTWKQAESVSAGSEFEDEGDNHFILTTVDMSSLGTVQGTVTLTIDGDSHIGTIENDANTGHVFGGGEESQVVGNTSVILSDNTQVMGSVYGGGKQGNVSGNTSVLIQD